MDGPATPQSAVQTPRGSKLAKLALIVLGIIILVVLSEAGYYFYTQKAGAPSPIPTPTPAPVGERTLTTGEPGQKALRYEKALSFTDGLEALVPKSSFFLSSTITSVTYGEVVNSVFEDNALGGVKYVYRLTRTNESGDFLNFWLTQDEVSRIKVILRNGETETPMELQDIRAGDSVLVRQEINLLADAKEDTITFEVTRSGP